MKDIAAVGIKSPKSWKQVLEQKDWHDLKTLESYLSAEVLGLEQLTEADWEFLVDIGINAHEIATYERAFRRTDPTTEVRQFNIVLGLINWGLVASTKETRWRAWISLWQLDKELAYVALKKDGEPKCLWNFEVSHLATGTLLKEATLRIGKPIKLEAPKPSDLKPLLGSPEKTDRELAIRIMANMRPRRG